jgi:hypothetical protein
MANQVLRDKNGNRLGEIREQFGRLVIVDKNGNRKGEYDPKTNVTRDRNGNRIGSGNLLTTLL